VSYLQFSSPGGATGGPRSGEAPLVVVLHTSQDEPFAAELRTHCAVLKNTSSARFWFEGGADPGARRDVEISEQMSRAAVVLVLLSKSFLESNTMRLVESVASSSQGSRVIPVLARACDWKSTGFSTLVPLPRNDSIAQHRVPDEAYTEIVRALRDILCRTATPPPQIAIEHGAAQPEKTGVRIWTVPSADNFWRRPDARALVRILSDAYCGRINQLLHVAADAGIPRVKVAFLGRAAEDVARDVIDLSRQRGVVRELLEALLDDEDISAYHPELDEMLNPSKPGRKPG
jgi:hypothetical protein